MIRNVSSAVDDGSSGGSGAAYSYGHANSPDRAIGSNPGAKSESDYGFQLALRNDTGRAITSFTLGYTGEQWRDCQGRSEWIDKLVVFYSTRPNFGFDYMGLDFVFVAPQDEGLNVALDGNDPANRRVIVGEYTPVKTISPGRIFYLTWHNRNSDGTDHALAIDDVWLKIVTE